MASLTLKNDAFSADFFIDEEAFKGIERVAGKVVGDFNKVTKSSKTVQKVNDCGFESFDTGVLFATVSNSKTLEKLEKEGLLSTADVANKWEVFKFVLLDESALKKAGIQGKNLLVIMGSDKLGTIYGMFTLSEKMGVSPMVYFADSVVPFKSNLTVSFDTIPSKEPSVKFRGLFINDEWPCYGNWTMSHFGGFNAQMYDNVFELLLRLKGNYMWPAMWSSSFAWDGPGLASYELASEYGIYIGNSHHEPCLRAGEEYRQVRGKGSVYGDAWNFRSNEAGITRFWRDSMLERGGFDSIVTVGMRGEADTKIMGENATLKDNIDLLKDVITCQHKLIAEAEEKYNKKFPKLLALYKEVEPFYYGDETTEGLCDWDGLDDVTLMLCEDNHGYMRTLPDEKMKNHPAGFGMYYHVDYHGDPISYEWINSTPLTTIWEQMSQCYDYGVREVWILNVGDLKHNEFPLSYFLNLAYDFEKYGTKAPNKCGEYTYEFMKAHFGGTLSDEMAKEGADILTETVRLTGMRRPEALNEHIFDGCHYNEADEMLRRISVLEKAEADFYSKLDAEQKNAWYSLTGFQTKAACNLYRMMLAGSKNILLAKQGRKSANVYADIIAETIRKDEDLKNEFASFLGGKWKGHEMASHIGFTKWNEDGCKYPLRSYVQPVGTPRLTVSRTDEERIYDKCYGPRMEILANDFLFEGKDSVSIVISNTGTGNLEYRIDMPEVKWLSVDKKEGRVANDAIVTFTCDRALLPTEKETVIASVSGAGAAVNVRFEGKKLDEKVKASLPDNTVFTGREGFTVLAKNYAKSSAPDGVSLVTLDDYGIFGSGVKAYPDTANFAEGKEPSLTYDVFVENAGEYVLETIFAPTSPLSRSNKLGYGVKVNDGEAAYYNTVPATYRAGVAYDRDWSMGTLNHRRVCTSNIQLKEGLNEVTVLLKDAGLVAMKLNIYDAKNPPKISYLGAKESNRK